MNSSKLHFFPVRLRHQPFALAKAFLNMMKFSLLVCDCEACASLLQHGYCCCRMVSMVMIGGMAIWYGCVQ
ncbi:hypothetical protein ACLB2K_049254 [Fragaria x ananassa]